MSGITGERMHASVVVYDYAMKMVGLPYIWAGDDPILGLDCSGLTIELLQAAGVLPQGFDTTAHGLWASKFFKSVEKPTFGALAFFGRPEEVTHVGFCLNELQMLEAGGGGSQTTSRDAATKQNAYVRVRKIDNRKDRVGFKKPAYPWEG
jgi:cell wall-associated NlpC family hydrolase